VVGDVNVQKTSDVSARMRKASVTKEARFIELFHSLYPLQRKTFCCVGLKVRHSLFVSFYKCVLDNYVMGINAKKYSAMMYTWRLFQ